jgi:hypothetical protein
VPTLVALDVHDDPDAWRAAGFAVAPTGACRVGAVTFHLSPPPAGGRGGIAGWTIDGLAAGVTELDGIATSPSPGGPADVGEAPVHPNGARALDHVVVSSPDLDRTIAAFEEAGLEARRVRDTEASGRPLRQVFFRPGEAIIELVGPPEPSGTGPSRFFGLAFTVDDLDAAAAHLGDHLGAAREAVQQGRRIATVRGSAGLGVPVAFMSTEPPR